MNKTTRIALVVLVALTMPALFSGCSIRSLGYSFDYSGVKVTQDLQGVITPETSSIVVDNQWGPVSVEECTSPNDQAGWNWSGAAWGSTEEDASLFLSNLEMVATNNAQEYRLELVYPQPNRELRGLKSNLTLKVPPGCTVEVRNRHGNLRASNLSGSATLKNAHGDVDVGNTFGTLDVELDHGETRASNLFGDSKFDVDHGDVEIVGSQNLVDVNHDHGSLTISQAAGPVIVDHDHGWTKISTLLQSNLSDANLSKSASSSDNHITVKGRHGNVSIDVQNTQLSRIDVDNAHGDVKISMPSTSTTQLDLDVSHGKQVSEFGHDAQGEVLLKCHVRHGDVKILKPRTRN